jgi:hypothetical protein
MITPLTEISQASFQAANSRRHRQPAFTMRQITG